MAEKKGNKKKQAGSSNSSFTNDLFGPKDPPASPSSSTLFGSVFGPPSSMRNHDLGGQYGNAMHGISGNNTHRGKGESSGSTMKDKSNKYDGQTVEPCYLSSSIYYGGQEVYSPNTQSNASQSLFNKDGRDDDDSNGSDSASRGNWWKGSLYY